MASNKTTVVELLADIEKVKAALQADIELEQTVSRDTTIILGTAAANMDSLHNSLDAFGPGLAEIWSKFFSERHMRSRLEHRLYLADQRSELFKQGLKETSETVQVALQQCVEIEAQV